MAREVRLPQLGQTMEEGTIVNCLVKVGDEVKKGDVIFEIETDKATLEMESPSAGFVKYILVETDQTLPVGVPILVLGDKDEEVAQSFVDSLKVLQSKREIPCFYLSVKADVTDLVQLRAKLNKTSPAKGRMKVAYNDFIIRAVAMGLEKFPIMTGQLAGDSIQLAEAIGIGLAISVPGGLVAPIVKDVNKKDVRQIARDTKALVEKARSNKLAPEDLEGGCFTVSNLGAFEIESFIPIVVPGQCSILGIGQISETCVPQDGNIMVRKLMSMVLSVDHKVTNGAYAAQFLDYVRKLLEDTATFSLGDW